MFRIHEECHSGGLPKKGFNFVVIRMFCVRIPKMPRLGSSHDDWTYVARAYLTPHIPDMILAHSGNILQVDPDALNPDPHEPPIH